MISTHTKENVNNSIGCSCTFVVQISYSRQVLIHILRHRLDPSLIETLQLLLDPPIPSRHEIDRDPDSTVSSAPSDAMKILLGIPRKTVYSRIQRGKDKLREAMLELAESPEQAESTMLGIQTWAEHLREEIVR